MTVEITVLPSYDEYLAANWFIFRKRWLAVNSQKYIAGFFGFVMAMQLLLYGFQGDGFQKFAPWAWFCSSLLITGVWFGLRALTQAISLPRALRNSYKVSQTINLRTSYTFTEVGLSIRNERITANYDWPFIVQAIENTRFLILLTPSWKGMYLFPKAQLDPAALAGLHAALIAANVPTR